MGNCLRHESSMQWGGDDWGSPAVDHRGFPGDTSGDMSHKKDTSYANYATTMSNSASTTAGTEVKIKITKKQLEELLSKADVKDMTVQQVLAKLISVSDRYQTQQIRAWRPALQSIPEVN